MSDEKENPKEVEMIPGRDSLTLSWLAETADGTRDEEWALVYQDRKELKLKKPWEVESGKDEELCRISTPSRQPDRRKVRAVRLYVEGSPEPIVLEANEGWDAVFWTESAVEKFLYPYYHCQRLWNSDMDLVKHKFDTNPTVVAIKHKAPSNSDTASVEGTLQIAHQKSDGTLEWLTLPQIRDL